MPESVSTVCPHCGAPRLGNGRPVTIADICDYFQVERHWVARVLVIGLSYVVIGKKRMYRAYDVLERWNSLQTKDKVFTGFSQAENL